MNRAIHLLALLLIIASILTPIPATITQANQPPQIKSNPSLPIAIVGDYDDGSYDTEGEIYQILTTEAGYDNVVGYSDWSDLYNDLQAGQDFSLVILNKWGSDPGSDIVSFLQELDEKNIPLLVLDAYQSDNGGYYFYKHRDSISAAGYPAPADRGTEYPDYSYVDIDILDNTHPIFDGVSSDPFLVGQSGYTNYAYYTSYQGPSVTELGHLEDTYNNYEGMGIVEWTAPGGEKWIIMSVGAVEEYMEYYDMGDGYGSGQWSEDMKTVLKNAVDYLIQSKPAVQYGLVKGYVWDADTGDPIEGALVCSGAICNTTDATGYYELNLTAGTKNVTASKLGYFKNTTTVDVPANGETWANFTLEKKPLGNIYVAVIGDLDNDIYDFLDQNYSVVSMRTTLNS